MEGLPEVVPFPESPLSDPLSADGRCPRPDPGPSHVKGGGGVGVRPSPSATTREPLLPTWSERVLSAGDPQGVPVTGGSRLGRSGRRGDPQVSVGTWVDLGELGRRGGEWGDVMTSGRSRPWVRDTLSHPRHPVDESQDRRGPPGSGRPLSAGAEGVGVSTFAVPGDLSAHPVGGVSGEGGPVGLSPRRTPLFSIPYCSGLFGAALLGAFCPPST